MDCVLAGMSSHAVPYIDDILVFSKDWTSHLNHVEQVLKRLSEANLTAKPSKCEWGKRLCQLFGSHSR